MKVGVIIQGPIQSPGITGAGWAGRTIKSVPKSHAPTSYDSSQDIIANYQYFKKRGCPVVVSVWQDCDTTEIEKIVDKNDIVRCSKDEVCEIFHEERKYLIQYLQLFTIEKGLEKIADQCEIVFKLRTDYRISFAEYEAFCASAEFQNWLQLGAGRFLVPYFLKNRLITMSDFYFFARVGDYQKMIEGCFRQRKYHDLKSAHYLFPMSFFAQLTMRGLDVFAKAYRGQFMSLAEILQFRRFFFEEIVQSQRMYPMPQSFFESSVWRGSRFVDDPMYPVVLKNILFADADFLLNIKKELNKFCFDLFLVRAQVYPPFGRWRYYFSRVGIKVILKTVLRRLLGGLNVKKFR